mmetsp:Transcript_55638/g.141063  ORF Transcript_55638/g.141063 Transcript_55638/m.141063 type:complete len:203 (+) Transcript_55638:267-875(+)
MAGNQQPAEQSMLPGLSHDGAEDAGLGRPLDAGMAGVQEVCRGLALEAIDDAPQARTAASPLLHRLTSCARKRVGERKAVLASSLVQHQTLVCRVFAEAAVGVVVQRNIFQQAGGEPDGKKRALTVPKPVSSAPRASADPFDDTPEGALNHGVVHFRLIGLVPPLHVLVQKTPLLLAVVVPQITKTALHGMTMRTPGRHGDE